MVKKLKQLCIESFFTCKKTELSCSFYCLFTYIYILMNRREIYFLCDNNWDDICLNFPNESKLCKHCKRLKKYNSLYQKIENERKNKTFRSIYVVDQITDFILKYKKYYILPEFEGRYCDLYHFRVTDDIYLIPF